MIGGILGEKFRRVLKEMRIFMLPSGFHHLAITFCGYIQFVRKSTAMPLLACPGGSMSDTRKKEKKTVQGAEPAAAGAKSAEQDLLALLGKGKKSPRHRARWLLLAGLALLLGGGAAAFLLLYEAEEATGELVYREYTVERGDITVGQTESSSISLTREVVTFPVSTTVEEVFVKPGSSVKAGDALVRLNTEDMQTGLSSFELQLEIMGLELEQAKMQLNTKLLAAKQQLETSRETGTLATDNRDVSIQELQLALNKAQSSLETAQDELSTYTNLGTTFTSDYQYLNDLEQQVEYWKDYATSIQEDINGATDYGSLRDTAEAELSTAWKQLSAAAVSLDASTVFLEAIHNDPNIMTAVAVPLAERIGAYYNMSSLSPGIITNADDTALRAVQQELSGWLQAVSDQNVRNVITTLSNALSTMGTQARAVQQYTQSAAGAASGIAALKEQLTSVQKRQSEAESVYNDFKEYYTERYGNISDYEELTAKIKTLTTDVEQAELSLTKAELSAQTGETTAEQKRESALSEQGTAKTMYELTEMELKQAVDAAQEEYNELERQIQEVKALLSEDGIVYAECNGMVSAVNVAEGDSISVTINKETKQISSYAQLLTMTNISDVYVPITISEEDILDVYIGQEATVTMTSFPGRTFTAEVDTISVEAARAGAATVSYSVSIRFSEENALDMYEGMSAEITLVQRAAQDVLYISNQAVTNTNGVATVLVRGADGSPVQQEVETGFSDGRYVELLSGLSEGDVVLVESAVGRT